MAQGRGSKTFSVSTDLSAFTDLMQEVVDASMDAVVPAAEAGAKLIYRATVQATPHGKKGHWFTGYNYKQTGARYWFNAGTLRASIYQVLSKDNTGRGFATYHISWNYKKAPYAFMVHNGTSKAAANPFVTIGRERSQDAAQDAMANKYLEILTARGLLS
jgi:hypothetical protein